MATKRTSAAKARCTRTASKPPSHADDPWRRRATITAGAHGPVTAAAQWMSAHNMATYYHLAAAPGLEINYRGHREDLVAAGLVTPEQLRARQNYRHDDDNGGSWLITGKACATRRGWIEVSFLLTSRVVAASMPGVDELFPEGLARITGAPTLRLVVDKSADVTAMSAAIIPVSKAAASKVVSETEAMEYWLADPGLKALAADYAASSDWWTSMAPNDRLRRMKRHGGAVSAWRAHKGGAS